MSSRRVLAVFLLLATLLGPGCDRSIGARILGIVLVEIDDTSPENLKQDAFAILETGVNEANVKLVVTSSGGRREHHYALIMTPDVFMESFPVQANLYLRHDDRDDPCDAIITDTLYFDLTPIVTLYQQMYGTSGQINLNMHNYEQSQSNRLILHFP